MDYKIFKTIKRAVFRPTTEQRTTCSISSPPGSAQAVPNVYMENPFVNDMPLTEQTASESINEQMPSNPTSQQMTFDPIRQCSEPITGQFQIVNTEMPLEPPIQQRDCQAIKENPLESTCKLRIIKAPRGQKTVKPRNESRHFEPVDERRPLWLNYGNRISGPTGPLNEQRPFSPLSQLMHFMFLSQQRSFGPHSEQRPFEPLSQLIHFMFLSQQKPFGPHSEQRPFEPLSQLIHFMFLSQQRPFGPHSEQRPFEPLSQLIHFMFLSQQRPFEPLSQQRTFGPHSEQRPFQRPFEPFNEQKPFGPLSQQIHFRFLNQQRPFGPHNEQRHFEPLSQQRPFGPLRQQRPFGPHDHKFFKNTVQTEDADSDSTRHQLPLPLLIQQMDFRATHVNLLESTSKQRIINYNRDIVNFPNEDRHFKPVDESRPHRLNCGKEISGSSGPLSDKTSLQLLIQQRDFRAMQVNLLESTNKRRIINSNRDTVNSPNEDGHFEHPSTPQ